MDDPADADSSRAANPETYRVAGERVALRPIRAEDATWAFDAVHENDAVLRWICWAGPSSVEELRERYAAWRTGEGTACDVQLAVCDRATGRPVGTISLKLRDTPGRGELGYWIASEQHGRGYAGEAVRLVTELAYRSLGADVLFAWVFVGNEPSRRLLERNGFHLEFTSTAPVPAQGREVDQWYFAQTRADWEDHRRRSAGQGASATGHGPLSR